MQANARIAQLRQMMKRGSKEKAWTQCTHAHISRVQKPRAPGKAPKALKKHTVRGTSDFRKKAGNVVCVL